MPPRWSLAASSARQVVDQPTDLTGEDQHRHRARAVPLDEAPPDPDQQPMVLANLDRRDEQHIGLRNARQASALGRRPIAQARAQLYDLDRRHRRSAGRRQGEEGVARMPRYGEHHVGDRHGVPQPVAELNDVPLLDERFVLDRDEIVDQHREPDAMAPLRRRDMLDVVGDRPAGAERHHDVAALHLPLERAAAQPQGEEIAHRRPRSERKKPGWRTTAMRSESSLPNRAGSQMDFQGACAGWIEIGRADPHQNRSPRIAWRRR